jgi:glycine reductase complex component B subunit gamma
MATPLRIVHYVNQFFAGIGGEDQAHVGVSIRDGMVGPGRALQQALGGGVEVVATLVCGDNFMSERPGEALAEIAAALSRLAPDAVVAGPAFGSGRYGLACAQVCRVAGEQGIPALTAMHHENPGAQSFRREVVIVPTGESAASMQPALEGVARLLPRLARKEELGPAELEGYLPQGRRRMHDRGRPGWQRALDMLLAKLHGRPFTTEVPYNAPEQVAPAPAIADLSRATIAMVTTGGLVRKGNPEKQSAANAVRYHRHSVASLGSLTAEGWEAYHAGYFNHIVNRNPNYILPLSFLREQEAKGRIARVHEQIYALPGVSTPVAVARELGRAIAQDLKHAGVDGALLVAT